MSQKKAIIIGAGPAGLTAAYELQKQTTIKPVILETTGDIGGISKTVNYKGNRMDIGGHRFFSKSDKVMKWWLNLLPIEEGAPYTLNFELPAKRPSPERDDLVMLVRNRVSRIYYLRKFFDYPISLNLNTISNLGLLRMMDIGRSYIWRTLFPIKEERSLEDFIVNRFGDRLYQTFFKEYTEKVWGVSCKEIEADWGAQRIKGLSIRKAILHAIKNQISKESSIDQKKVETSLIERFLYPKLGPGQLWEEVAARVEKNGAEIHLHHTATTIETTGNVVTAVTARDAKGQPKTFKGDYFFSTMPVKDLINGLTPPPPKPVIDVANGLLYRDFITVGVLLKKLKVKDGKRIGLIKDNWIYIQEPNVRIGRLQIYNNWSPYMVQDPDTVWLGLEYFCNEDDDLWQKTDDDFARFAVEELVGIDIIDHDDVMDSIVIRMPKTYPGYFGSYKQFGTIRDYTDTLENLFLIGRNGMHRYNNQDHSMLTAMTAVENIVAKNRDKANIWAVNTEDSYHEKK